MKITRLFVCFILLTLFLSCSQGGDSGAEAQFPNVSGRYVVSESACPFISVNQHFTIDQDGSVLNLLFVVPAAQAQAQIASINVAPAGAGRQAAPPIVQAQRHPDENEEGDAVAQNGGGGVEGEAPQEGQLVILPSVVSATVTKSGNISVVLKEGNKEYDCSSNVEDEEIDELVIVCASGVSTCNITATKQVD